MTPTEFKEARKKLGLTQSALAAVLNVNSRTVRKWEAEDAKDDRPPNPIACRVLEWMLDGFRPPEFPAKAGRPDQD